MVEVFLISCLLVSIITILIMANKKNPLAELINYNSELIESNLKLKSEIEKLKGDLINSENRRKKILSINKGERALISDYSLSFGKGTDDEISFNAYFEVDVIDVTDKKIKVSPYKVTTDNKIINSDQSRIKSLLDFLKDKWVDISECQTIIDTRVRREDKLEELTDGTI